ncbi:MAG: hypothetical protein AAF570_05440 [Bacteroidota bacterium]
MKHFRPTSLFVLLVTAALSFATVSCKKIQQNYIMNGEWEVLEVNLNGGTLNQMEQFLPDYVSNSTCCKYVVTFGDEGVCTSTLTIDGDIREQSVGEWNMPERSKIYFKVDEYVDGLFDLEREGDGVWILHAPVNNIEAYNVGEVEMAIRTTRIKN